jgi:N-methylhydantoinase B
MDHIAGGCGARSFADGVGSAGDSNSPTLAIPDIETHEAFNPVLFLYRRELQDAGGPGKFRGGVSMEEAFMPHDTDRLVLHFGAHGTEAPNSAGIFGGCPGCGPRYTVFRGTSVRGLLAAGEVPQSSDAVGGEITVQPARASGVTLEKDDVLAYHWSGGGGYGDPLDRNPEAVARDVAVGLVSDAVARQIYGVVLVSGEVSQAATEELRASLRRTRSAASAGTDTRENLAAGSVFRFRVGESLDVREKEGRDVFACRRCHLYLGDVTENYKEHALARDRPLEELGPPFPPKLRTRFVLREFCCPGCGTQLEADLVRPGQPVLWDIELKDTRSVRSKL